MSHLTLDDIKKLAQLSQIDITTQEEEKYLKDINGILEHISMVSGAQIDDTDKVLSFVNNTRQDSEDERDFDVDIIFANVPQKSKDNYVKVAKVIKK